MSTPRDTTRQPATLARQSERRTSRSAKNATAQESAASFAQFAKNHNAMISRRSQVAS